MIRMIMLEQFLSKSPKRSFISSPYQCTILMVPKQLYRVLVKAYRLWKNRKFTKKSSTYLPAGIIGKLGQRLKTWYYTFFAWLTSQILLQVCWPSRIASACPDSYSTHSYQALFNLLKKISFPTCMNTLFLLTRAWETLIKLLCSSFITHQRLPAAAFPALLSVRS